MASATEVVIVQDIRDAMAHELVSGEKPGRAYICVTLGAEDAAVDLLAGLHDKNPDLARVTISTRNSSEGMLHAHRLMRGLERKEGLRAVYVPPPGARRSHQEALKNIMSSSSVKLSAARDAIVERARNAVIETGNLALEASA